MTSSSEFQIGMWSMRHRNRDAGMALAESIPLTCVPLYEGIEPSSLVAVASKLAVRGGFEPPGAFTPRSLSKRVT